MEIKTAKEIILFVLENNKETRSDDRLLITSVWENQNPNIFEESYSMFCQKFLNGELFHSETIRRNRQLLQKNNVELRGSNYGKRKNHQEEVKEEIRGYNN